MNYLSEIVAFTEWKEVNQLPASAIALWYELMAICNKTGWQQEFTVPNGLLQIKAGLSRKEFEHARQLLIQAGRIQYKKSNRVNQAGKYEIIPFVQNGQREGQQKGQQEGQQQGQQKEHRADNERGTLYKHKQNETKFNNGGSNSSLAEIVSFYENNIGLVAPAVAEEFEDLVKNDLVDPAVIIEALKIAIDKNVRNWAYARAIINAAIKENACTIESFRAWQNEHEAKKAEQKLRKQSKQKQVSDTDAWLKEITEMAGIKENED